jgi:hypothetical protein
MDNADDQLFYIVQEAFDAVTQGVVDGLAAIDLVTSSAFWGTIVDDVNLATSLASMGFSATVQAILQDADAAAIRTELDVVEDVTTTRGDIIYRNATVPARLAVGAANTLLKSDGTDPSWTTVAAIMDSLLTTRGDILRVGSSTTERLALGASGAALVSDGTDAVWGYTQYQGCVGLKLSNDTDTAHDVNVTAGPLGRWVMTRVVWMGVKASPERRTPVRFIMCGSLNEPTQALWMFCTLSLQPHRPCPRTMTRSG